MFSAIMTSNASGWPDEDSEQSERAGDLGQAESYTPKIKFH